MKLKLNNVKFLKKSLTLVGVFAIVGLGLTTLAYLKYTEQVNAGLHDAALTDTMQEAARYHFLLAQINSGRVDEAKKFLNDVMKHDVSSMTTISQSSNATLQAFAREVADHVSSKPNYLASIHRVSFDPATAH
jgi:Tfp pilus assembly protein PilE